MSRSGWWRPLTRIGPNSSKRTACLDNKRDRSRAPRGAGQSRLLLALALAAVIALLLVGQAVATHVDSMRPTDNYSRDCFDGTLTGDNVYCQTDDYNVRVWRGRGLDSTGRTNIGQMLADEFRTTDLAITFVQDPVHTGPGETDIIYQQNTPPGESDGFAWCNDAVDARRCDQHYNVFRSSSPSKGLACHESGHAVGLTHGVDAAPMRENDDPSFGCMQTPVPTSNTGQLGTHNRATINATY